VHRKRRRRAAFRGQLRGAGGARRRAGAARSRAAVLVGLVVLGAACAARATENVSGRGILSAWLCDRAPRDTLASCAAPRWLGRLQRSSRGAARRGRRGYFRARAARAEREGAAAQQFSRAVVAATLGAALGHLAALALTFALRGVARLLLLLAGVEPNPGPPRIKKRKDDPWLDGEDPAEWAACGICDALFNMGLRGGPPALRRCKTACAARTARAAPVGVHVPPQERWTADELGINHDGGGGGGDDAADDVPAQPVSAPPPPPAPPLPLRSDWRDTVRALRLRFFLWREQARRARRL
jgi:hypothetical protein